MLHLHWAFRTIGRSSGPASRDGTASRGPCGAVSGAPRCAGIAGSRRDYQGDTPEVHGSCEVEVGKEEEEAMDTNRRRSGRRPAAMPIL
jgi:hypothetical protein